MNYPHAADCLARPEFEYMAAITADGWMASTNRAAPVTSAPIRELQQHGSRTVKESALADSAPLDEEDRQLLNESMADCYEESRREADSAPGSSGGEMKHTFEVRREALDVTRDGSLGGERDEFVRRVPGLAEYFIDGIPVTEEEFKKAREADAEEAGSE